MKPTLAIAVILLALTLIPAALSAQEQGAAAVASVQVQGEHQAAPVTKQMRIMMIQDDTPAGSPGPVIIDNEDELMTNPGQVVIAQGPTKGTHAGPGQGVSVEKNVFFYRKTGAGPRWWKNSDMVQKIGVSDAQVQQMENIFQENRIRLIDLKAGLDKQEARLEPLMQADNPDEGQIGSQIDKVAAARAELEKANALMLVSIRRVLTLDQWKKLQALQPQGMGPVNITFPLPPPEPATAPMPLMPSTPAPPPGK